MPPEIWTVVTFESFEHENTICLLYCNRDSMNASTNTNNNGIGYTACGSIDSDSRSIQRRLLL